MTPSAHPVLGLIRARAEARSRPGERSDGYRLGLALEGGAMRGVISAGMICGLERLGLLEAFDAVYGTSAGAINGAFFVARQAVYGTPIYWDHINNSRFINTLRLLSKTPVLALAFLLDHVMVREKTLDWRAVVDSRAPLIPVAVSLESLEAVPLTGFCSREELLDALRASASVPLVSGPPAEFGRRRYLDGGMVEPASFGIAVKDGCTHVLVLATLPQDRVRFHNPLLTDVIVTIALERLRPGLSRMYRHRPERYLAAYRQLAEATLRPSGPPYLFAVRPSADEDEIHWFERRRNRLMAGARQGMEALCRALVGDPRQDLWPRGWSDGGV